MLDNVLDPSAIVPREYQVLILRLDDGRVVQGVIAEENPKPLRSKPPTSAFHSRRRHRARKNSPLSMMPEGLLDRLTPDEVRDLVAYLGSPQQARWRRATQPTRI